MGSIDTVYVAEVLAVIFFYMCTVGLYLWLKAKREDKIHLEKRLGIRNEKGYLIR